MNKSKGNLNSEHSFYLFSRYFLLLLFSIGNLYVFYKLFTPLTLYPAIFVLKEIYGSSASLLANNSILLSGITISIIPACIAGAAYYLLSILNLSTPMALKIRLKSLLFLFGAFLIVNIIRIVTFSIIALNSPTIFNQLHLWTWYFGSTLFVVVLWFINVKIFKIKSIPIYSDFKLIIKSI